MRRIKHVEVQMPLLFCIFQEGEHNMLEKKRTQHHITSALLSWILDGFEGGIMQGLSRRNVIRPCRFLLVKSIAFGWDGMLGMKRICMDVKHLAVMSSLLCYHN